MSIHPSAQSFGSVVSAYDRARPDYPQDALDWLVAELDLRPGRAVVDLAAGTGKLTGPLARTGARVIAVEPSPEMLARLRQSLPGVEAHEGTAQQIPLADGVADAVCVAQAFHWFATEEALAEIRRVLAPGGRLALVWNRRETSHPGHAELDAIILPLQDGTPRHRSGEWRRAMEATELFEPGPAEEFRFEQELTVQGFVERAESISFIAALEPRGRSQVLAQVQQVGRRLGEPIVLPHTAEVFTYRRR